MDAERTKSIDFSLYLVTDRDLAGGRSLEYVVAEAVAGGVRVVQVREKTASSRTFYEVGRRLREHVHRRGVPLIVNDRVDIMLALDADGVHVGSEDLPADVVRRLAGKRLLGVSAGSLEELRAAEAAGADYVGAGPVFPTPTKPDAGPALGLDGLRRIVEATSLPVVAIGGINAANAAEVAAAGVAGIAVVSAIMAAADPRSAAAELLDAFRRGKERFR